MSLSKGFDKPIYSLKVVKSLNILILQSYKQVNINMKHSTIKKETNYLLNDFYFSFFISFISDIY